VVQSPFSPRFPSRGGPPLGQQEHLIWVDAGDFIFFADPALLLEQHKEQVKRSNVVATYSKAWAWGWLRDQWDTIWKMVLFYGKTIGKWWTGLAWAYPLVNQQKTDGKNCHVQ